MMCLLFPNVASGSSIHTHSWLSHRHRGSYQFVSDHIWSQNNTVSCNQSLLVRSIPSDPCHLVTSCTSHRTTQWQWYSHLSDPSPVLSAIKSSLKFRRITDSAPLLSRWGHWLPTNLLSFNIVGRKYKHFNPKPDTFSFSLLRMSLRHKLTMLSSPTWFVACYLDHSIFVFITWRTFIIRTS